MQGACALRTDGGAMGSSAVAFVPVKAVRGILCVRCFDHPSIACRLGKNGCCSDADVAGVAFDEALMVDGVWTKSVAVDAKQVNGHTLTGKALGDIIDRLMHGVIGRLQDVHTVDVLVVQQHHRPSDRLFDDEWFELSAPRRRQDLGVRDAVGYAGGIKHNGGGSDGPGKGSSPGFVDPGDDVHVYPMSCRNSARSEELVASSPRMTDVTISLDSCASTPRAIMQ